MRPAIARAVNLDKVSIKICEKHRSVFPRSTTEAEQEDFVANLPICRKIAVAFPNSFRQTCELPLVSICLETWDFRRFHLDFN